MTVIVLAERSNQYLVMDTKDVQTLRPDREKVIDRTAVGLDDVIDSLFTLTLIFKEDTRPRWTAKDNLPEGAVLGDRVVVQPPPVSGIQL